MENTENRRGKLRRAWTAKLRGRCRQQVRAPRKRSGEQQASMQAGQQAGKQASRQASRQDGKAHAHARACLPAWEPQPIRPVGRPALAARVHRWCTTSHLPLPVLGAAVLDNRLRIGRDVAERLRGHAAQDHLLALAAQEVASLLDGLDAGDVQNPAAAEVQDDNILGQAGGAEAVLVVHGRTEEEGPTQHIGLLVGLVLVFPRLHPHVGGGRPREAEAAEHHADNHRDAQVLPDGHHRDEDHDDGVDPVDPEDERQGAPSKGVQRDERDEAHECGNGDDLHHGREQQHAEAQGDAHDKS
mmetsp:Transcript_57619/g.178940  ORF Transcript_57619/g.178940 Transcript_57619/m.178940 type:complete len:300 (+) Transcript_57619:130-1029(+)